MLKAVIGLGTVTLLFTMAVIFVPSVAEAVPQSGLVRDFAAPVAVIVSLIAAFAWRPRSEDAE